MVVAAGCMSSPTCGLVPHENLTHGRIRRRMRWLRCLLPVLQVSIRPPIPPAPLIRRHVYSSSRRARQTQRAHSLSCLANLVDGPLPAPRLSSGPHAAAAGASHAGGFAYPWRTALNKVGWLNGHAARHRDTWTSSAYL
jgi:hypothetical protein